MMTHPMRLITQNNPSGLWKAPLATGVLLALVVLNILIPASFADPGKGKHHGVSSFNKGHSPRSEADREARRKEMSEKLGLTSEQSERLRTIHDKNRGQAKSLREQMQTKQQTLMEYMS